MLWDGLRYFIVALPVPSIQLFYSIFPWLLLPDFIWSLMRLLKLKARYMYGPFSAFLMNIFFALKDLNFFYSELSWKLIKTVKEKLPQNDDLLNNLQCLDLLNKEKKQCGESS